MRRLTLPFTLIFLAVLAVDAYPGLRGGGGWRWPYAAPDNAIPVVILAAVLSVYLLGLWALRRRDARPRTALAWIVLAGTVLGYAVTGIAHGDAAFTLFTRTVSPVQTGASTVAVREMADNGLNTTLERWPQVMTDALDANIIHFTTSPPGQPLIHYGVAELTDTLPGAEPMSMALRPFQCADIDVMRYSRGEIISAGVIGLLMPFFAALAALPVYWAAGLLQFTGRAHPQIPSNGHGHNVLRDEGGHDALQEYGRNALRPYKHGDDKLALRLAAWWPLVPTILLFTPTWNVVYPALCVWAFALLLRGIVTGHGYGWMVAAGAVMSFTTFLNFAVAPIFLLFGLFTLGYWWINRAGLGSFAWSVTVGAAFGVGLLSVWMAFFAASGYTPLDLAQVTAEKHSTLVAGRDYLTWLLLHPYDVLMFVGWPLAALFLWGVMQVRPRELTPVHVLAGSMLVTLLAVNIAGVVQGENARILAYYAPFLLLAGGAWLSKQSPRGDWPLLTVQAACVLVMGAVLPVVPLDLNPPPDGPATDFTTLDDTETRSINAAFSSTEYAGTFTLDDYRFVADLGLQVITLETFWQGGQTSERPYTFEIIARANNEIEGDIVTLPQEFVAQFGNYPPTCWREGEQIRDVTQITLPVISAPVQWTLDLRAIDPRTGDVMQVRLPDGTVTDTVALGPVPYP